MVLMPIALATSSSSLMATQARPMKESRRRRVTNIARRQPMMIRYRNSRGESILKPNMLGD